MVFIFVWEGLVGVIRGLGEVGSGMNFSGEKFLLVDFGGGGGQGGGLGREEFWADGFVGYNFFPSKKLWLVHLAPTYPHQKQGFNSRPY